MDIYTRRLFESRMFEKPIAHMKERVSSLLAGNETRDSLKYYIQSAHDTNIVNTLLWLAPINYDFIDAPFASSLYFELHYDDQCLQT